MTTAVLGSQVDGAITYVPFAITNKARVRPLAVAMEQRHPLMPEVPTFKELGVNWVDGAYRGIGVPKSTTPEQRKRLSDLWANLNNDPEMKELAAKNGLANLAYKLGDIERVPLADASVDLAILSQALHHAQHPQRAVEEAHRILKPGGQILILDLAEHTFEKARELYADVWLGFKESALHGFLKHAGFQLVEVSTVAKEPTEPFFETLLASGVKPTA
jgi:SAM-dependent methyltransferase